MQLVRAALGFFYSFQLHPGNLEEKQEKKEDVLRRLNKMKCNRLDGDIENCNKREQGTGKNGNLGEMELRQHAACQNLKKC